MTNGDPLNLPIFGSRDPLLFGGLEQPHAWHGVLRTVKSNGLKTTEPEQPQWEIQES